MESLKIVQKLFPQVRHILEARKSIRIQVTDRDTKSASVKNHKECALAVACKRMLPIDGVIISRSVAYAIVGDKATRYMLPQSASREIVSFDRGSGFYPGTYQLSRPAKAERRAARRSRKNSSPAIKTGVKGQTWQKRFHHVTENIRGSLLDKGTV